MQTSEYLISNTQNKTFLRGVWPQQKASHFITEYEYSCGNYLSQCLLKMDFICRWVPSLFNRLATGSKIWLTCQRFTTKRLLWVDAWRRDDEVSNATWEVMRLRFLGPKNTFTRMATPRCCWLTWSSDNSEPVWEHYDPAERPGGIRVASHWLFTVPHLLSHTHPFSIGTSSTLRVLRELVQAI